MKSINDNIKRIHNKKNRSKSKSIEESNFKNMMRNGSIIPAVSTSGKENRNLSTPPKKQTYLV